MQLTKNARNTLFAVTVVAAWSGLFLGMFTVTQISRSQDTQKNIDTISAYQSAGFFASNYVQAFLATSSGDENAIQALQHMTAHEVAPDDFPATPFQVLQTHAFSPRTAVGQAPGEREWSFQVGATVLAPGASNYSRKYFHINIIEYDIDSFSALLLPRPTGQPSTSITVPSKYSYDIDSTSSAAIFVSKLFTAWYLDRPDADTARLTTKDCPDRPVTDSPFTHISVQSMSSLTKVDPEDPGVNTDTLRLLVNARAGMSDKTYLSFQAPITLRKSADDQWLLQRFDDIIDYGEIKKSDG